MASDMELVARQIFEGLGTFAKTGCDQDGDDCTTCEAEKLCKAALDLRDEARVELDRRRKREAPNIHKPNQTEADQRKNLCDALTGTVSKLHTMMETAMEEESIETVLDISGQIIDCAECIVKLQSGMVDVKLLQELMQCQEEAEGEDE